MAGIFTISWGPKRKYFVRRIGAKRDIFLPHGFWHLHLIHGRNRQSQPNNIPLAIARWPLQGALRLEFTSDQSYNIGTGNQGSWRTAKTVQDAQETEAFGQKDPPTPRNLRREIYRSLTTGKTVEWGSIGLGWHWLSEHCWQEGSTWPSLVLRLMLSFCNMIAMESWSYVTDKSLVVYNF